MPNGKRFTWFYPLVIVATLALGLPVLAGPAAAASPIPAPYISLPAAISTFPSSVTITDTIKDPIYYTTDGTDPETSNTAILYSGAFSPPEALPSPIPRRSQPVSTTTCPAGAA